MANILIEPAKAKTILSREDSLESALKRLSQDVESIRGGLRFRIAAQQNISQNLRSIAEQIDRESRNTRAMREGLEQVIAHYEQTEKAILEQLTEEEFAIAAAAEKGGMPIFDDKANEGYGGDQGDLAHSHNGFKLPWGWVFFEDKKAYEFVKEHEGFENYTEAQIHDLFKQMNNEGCGYIGLVNAIFSEFEGSEGEFERLFGFPMRDKGGNYNYNYMFIDLYCSTDNKYYLNERNGVVALAIEMMCSYGEDSDAFYRKYGVELGSYDANGQFQYSDEAKIAIVNEINTTYDSNDVVTYDASRDGLTVSAQENHAMAYLRSKGIDPENASYTCSSTMSRDTVKDNLANGKVSQVLLLDGTEMYKDDGSVSVLPGGHYVTITGVADDGRFIVSSWGDKYYIDPEQANVATYQTIALELKR